MNRVMARAPFAALLALLAFSARAPAYDDIQLERGTAAQWTSINPILKEGEPGWDLTNKILKIGDGTSTWSAIDGIVPHAAVTLSGTWDYVTLTGQQIVVGLVDLSTDVTGTLPWSAIGGAPSFVSEGADAALLGSGAAAANHIPLADGLGGIAWGSLPWSALSGKPTTVAGAGLLDALTVGTDAADLTAGASTSGQVLTSDGSGGASWANPAIGSETDPIASAALSAHTAAADPHPVYTTSAEASAAAPVQTVAGRTGTVTLAAADVSGAVPDTRTITCGNGLSGGGDLSANRTCSVVAGDGTIGLAADSVVVNKANIPLDSLGAATDTTTLNATTSAHGLLPKLDGSATKSLRGDGTWAAHSLSQPVFAATVTVDTGGLTNRSHDYQIGADLQLTEQIDTANAYNPAGSPPTWTAPVTGMYEIIVNYTSIAMPVATAGPVTAISAGIRVERNGTAIMYVGYSASAVTRANSTTHIVSLTAGDTLRFRTFATTATNGSTFIADGEALDTPWRAYTIEGQPVSGVSIRALPTLSESDAAAPPSACVEKTDSELVALGYEPVTLHGATPDDSTDDRVAIQAAMDTAYLNGRVTYFRPGTYRVSARELDDCPGTRTLGGDGLYTCTTDNPLSMVGYSGGRSALVARLKPGNVPDNPTQLLGSSCGAEKPTILMIANQDTRTIASNFSAIANEPTSTIVFIRDYDLIKDNVRITHLPRQTPADLSQNPANYGGRVRNLRFAFESGNEGAVAIRGQFAEGGELVDVDIDDAEGEFFAGLYECVSSGAGVHHLTVTGGWSGIFCPTNKGGPTNFSDVRLENQIGIPIVRRMLAPITFAGLSITHATGPMLGWSTLGDYGSIQTVVPGTVGDGYDHFLCVDCAFEVTGTATLPMFSSTDRTLYFENSYFKGATDLVSQTFPTPDQILKSPAAGSWYRVGKFATPDDYNSVYGDYGKLIAGVKNGYAMLNGTTYASTATLPVLADQSAPPADLLSRHDRFPRCEPRDIDAVWAHQAAGVTRNDGADDYAGLSAVIASAAAAGKRVMFAPGTYNVAQSLVLPANGKLCGVNGINERTEIAPTSGTPATTRYVLDTVASTAGGVEIADINITHSSPTGSFAGGWGNSWKPIRIRTPAVLALIDINRPWGVNPGPLQEYTFTGAGGGATYSINSGINWFPGQPNATDFAPLGVCQSDPNWATLWVENNTTPLTIYSGHIQFPMPCGGAQSRFIGANNVTIFGTKSETASLPQKLIDLAAATNPAYHYLFPRVARITNSQNVKFVGYEGLSSTASGYAIFEVDAPSSNIEIVAAAPPSVAQAWPLNTWYMVEDAQHVDTIAPIDARAGRIRADGLIGYFRAD